MTNLTENSGGILPSAQKIPRRNRFKNLLLGFFIFEHLAIFLLLFAPIIFYVRTYAYSSFDKLEQKASNFKPIPKEQAIQNLVKPILPELEALGRNPGENRPISVTVDENDLNSLITDFKLEHLKKIYLALEKDNQVNFWVLIEEVPQPLTLNLQFGYHPEEKITLDVKHFQLGPIPLPTSWLDSLEISTAQTINKSLKEFEGQYGFNLKNLSTTEGKIIFTFEPKGAKISNPMDDKPLKE